MFLDLVLTWNDNSSTPAAPVPPSISLPAVVEAFPGYFVTIPVTGTPPTYTAIIRNSTVLVNTTGTAAFRFYEESNCTCVASSNYGSDVNEFSVILKGQVISSTLRIFCA
ncbi:unnamed protein product [Pocillopora meandrina]|uniref:Uncharacterized protein n=1 Tax=Pocillopora meandrina TaxID=46732 RepID=A0AAU9W6U6_9CNID|nr:unnamed protein product [Pocillopora meandrina]